MKKYFLLTVFAMQLLNVIAQNWLPTGLGTNNGNNGGITLNTYNGKLIAGGAFSKAGNADANGVAMWDGNDWSIVDSSMNNFFYISPFVEFNGQLYGFVKIDGTRKGNILRLDSNFKWHVVPNSTYSSTKYTSMINSAIIYKNELYLSGGFDSIGNIAANHIAKWDGTNWMPLGAGVFHEYGANMKVFQNELYAGGAFSQAGNVYVNNLAKWNGTQWSDVGGGITPNYYAFRTMEVYKDELYIGGDFEFANGKPMMHITKWNGSKFSDVGGGLGFAGSPNIFKVFGKKLYIGGYFNTGLFQNQAGTWDGVKYESLGTGLSDGPTDFEIYKGKLYAGGRFKGFTNGVAVLDTTDFTTSVLNINSSENTISIYPNPFTFQTTISFSVEQKNTTIIITDLLGNEIYSEIFSGKRLLLNKADMKAGIYFLETIDKKNHTTNNKIIIQ